MPVRVEVPGRGVVEFPDGTPPDVMEQALAEFRTAEPDAPEHPHARVARLVKENLPAVGGTIGGLLGAVGGPAVAAGTAGLGGAAGRLAQRALAGDVKNLPEMAGDAATSGAIQAGTEAVGGVVGKGLAAGGRRLYQGLLKPSAANRREYPDAVKTLVGAGAPIAQGGLRKIEGMLQRSSAEADDMIRAASPGAPLVRAKEVVPEFAGTVKELRKRVDIGQPSEMAAVGQRGRNLMKQEPAGGWDLTRAQELKKTAQNAASAGYRQAERGTVKEVTTDTMLDKDVARGFRKAIETRVPQVAGINKRTQSLGGAKDALEDAIGREGNTLALGGAKDFLATAGAVGSYAAGSDPQQAAGLGLLVRLLATPATGSRAAIAAARAAQPTALALPQLLRLLSVSHE